MKLRTVLKSNFLLMSVIVLVACKHEPVLLPESPIVCFQDQVLPVISSNCAMPGCHDQSSDEGPVLTNYDNIMQYIEPLKPNKSKLYKVITSNSLLVESMPPKSSNQLTQEQINLISIWILQGAENNSCLLIPCDSVNVSYSASIYPIIENYCKGCHSGGNPSGGISLENYEQISAVALNGKLYGSVSSSQGYIPMPYNGPMLPDCYVAMIKNWTDNGAPDN